MANPDLMKHKNIIDVIKYRGIWLSLSAILLIPCIIAVCYLVFTQPNHSPLKLGIDYTGGTILQYSTSQEVTTSEIEKIRTKLIDEKFQTPVVQVINNKTASIENKENQNGTSDKNIVSIKTTFLGDNNNEGIDKVTQIVNEFVKDPDLVQTNSIGPSLGSELLKNSLVALCLAFLGIVVYISFRFQADYAIIALLALFHDALFVIGVFAIMGIFFDWYADSLFITAILTVIGFSVHDTIVVFDRVRENNRFLAKKYTFDEIVNASVNQTLARSINTSVTTLMTLLALYIFGGTTTRDFVLAMILGIAIGTYSSIFFASTLLAWNKDIREARQHKQA